MASYLIPDKKFGRKDLVKFDTILADYPTFKPYATDDNGTNTTKGERHYYGEDTPNGKEYVAMVSGPNSKIQLIRSTLRSDMGKMLIRDLIKAFEIKKYRDDTTKSELPIEELYLAMVRS